MKMRLGGKINRSTIRLYFEKIVEHIAISDSEARNILITSAELNKERTTIALFLAIASAILKPNKRILFVDLDLRNSIFQRSLGFKANAGMREIIANTKGIEDAVYASSLTNLKVIPVGKKEVDFPDAFKSEEMIRFLKEIRSQYDLAFYDSSPINKHIDARILSGLMDAVILVIRSERSKREEVLSAKNEIESGGGKIMGVIMSDFRNPIPSFLDRRL